MAAPRIDCRRCTHYFVTWDPRFPHGCRRMGFKSRMTPIEEVRRAMPGHDECLLFHAKARRHAHGSRLASPDASEPPPAR